MYFKDFVGCLCVSYIKEIICFIIEHRRGGKYLEAQCFVLNDNILWPVGEEKGCRNIEEHK